MRPATRLCGVVPLGAGSTGQVVTSLTPVTARTELGLVIGVTNITVSRLEALVLTSYKMKKTCNLIAYSMKGSSSDKSL